MATGFHRAVQGGFGDVVGGLGRQVVGVGNELGLVKAGATFVFQPGFLQVGLGRALVGDGEIVAGGGGIAGGQIIVGLDLDEQVALLDMLALLDRQFDDFAADFRAELDLDDRLDLAVGHDFLDEIAPRHFLHLHRDGRIGLFQRGDDRDGDDRGGGD